MNNNTAQGTAKKIEGKIQEVGGHLRAKVNNAFGDTEGAARGTADEVKGLAKQGMGEAQKKVGQFQDAAKESVNSEE